MAHLHVIIFLTTPWFFALFISLEALYTEINCKSSPKMRCLGMLDCACRILAAYAHTLHHLCIAIDRYVLLLLFLTRLSVKENNFQIFLDEN